MNNDFFSWETLKTLTGVSTATGLITQFTKSYVPIPTQVLAYIISLIILIAVTVYNQNYKNIPLCFLNAFISSSLASNTVSLVNRLS